MQYQSSTTPKIAVGTAMLTCRRSPDVMIRSQKPGGLAGGGGESGGAAGGDNGGDGSDGGSLGGDGAAGGGGEGQGTAPRRRAPAISS